MNRWLLLLAVAALVLVVLLAPRGACTALSSALPWLACR
jgi:hypothetical protein